MYRRCSVITPVRYVETAEYDVDHNVLVGSIVKISIRNKSYFGLVTHILEKSDQLNINVKKAELTHFIINQKYLNFINQFAQINITYKSFFVHYITKQLSSRNFKSATQFVKPISINLNVEQNNAVTEIMKSISSFLLFGVTGSGKTEVFFKITHEIIQNNGQVLILLPEIAITESIFSRFEKAFNFKPYIWHSNAKKKSTFMNILNGHAKVIIGSRSALLLPFNNLQLIIIDEEHDISYKQKNNPVYNCRDMAVLRGQLEGFRVILSSATPSVESFYNSQINKYKLIKLTKRYSDRSMPSVTIKGAETVLSQYAKERIWEEIKTGGQVVLFLNRRGIAPTVVCKQCNTRLICLDCTSGLVLHKPYLMCHKCNQKFDLDKCLNCQAINSLVFYGLGVERVAELVKKNFIGYNVKVLSSDTCTSGEKIREFLDQMHQKKIQIVVGTQMIAKGHDFPDISLVVVLNFSDLGYDFRSSESLFQNLMQITGRAGRGNRKSEVIVQTHNRNNYLLRSLKKHDYTMFLQKEIEERKIWKLPPFFKIILVKIMNNNNQKAFSLAENIQDFLKNISEEIYDPVCIGRIRGQYLYHLICKISQENFKLNLDLLNKYFKKENVLVDIDPYDLMNSD